MIMKPRILTVFILSCVTLVTSTDNIIPRESQNYQDVIQNAIHAREKYLKSSNQDIIHQKHESSKMVKDSANYAISLRAAKLLQGDPGDVPTDWRFDVSDLCLNHTEMFLEGLVSLEPWALRMLDAIGKPGSNLLYAQLTWVGSYEECLSVQAQVNKSGEIIQPFEGQYCTASIQATKPVFILPAGVTFNVGLCVPSSCSTRDTFSLVYTLAYLLDIDTNTMKPPGVDCKEHDRDLSSKAITVIVIGSLFAALIVIATAYDVIVIQWLMAEDRDASGYQKLPDDTKYLRQNGATPSYGATYTKTPLDDKSNTENGDVVVHTGRNGVILENKAREYNTDVIYEPGLPAKLLLSFSIYTNAKKILNTNSPAGTLTAVNGIRFISMTWVILGHTYAFGLGQGSNLYDFYPTMLKRLTFQAISNATVSVDTFFTLSGLLVAYLSLKEMKKRDGPLKFKWAMFYFHRFWRLTPPYMLFIMLYVPVNKYLSDGPFWPNNGFEQDECEGTWWTNLLYINNIVKSNKMCAGWSWYLANDMQFYVLSPLMLIPLYLSPILGGLSCLTFLAVSMISTGVISSVNETGVGTVMGGGAFDKIYVKPWCRVGPYAIGFFAGYILYRTNCKIKLNKIVNLLIWLVAAALALLVLYGLWDPDNMSPQLSNDVAALYNATFRNVWAAAVAWVVIACATGNGGWINTLLSWKAIIPLSRLTYCAYLIHPVVLYYYYSTRRQLIYFDDLEMIYIFCGHLVLSFAGAFILSLAFEAPMMGLEKVLLGRGKSR